MTRCTCDDHCDDPCPVHAEHNMAQDNRLLDAYFRAAGLAALLAEKDARLIAGANHLENFTHWACGAVNAGIVDAFRDDVPAHVGWFNAYCEGPPMYQRPFIREVCQEAYEKLDGGSRL